jgi:5-formyltetrahydrofolate cyclo-ligase
MQLPVLRRRLRAARRALTRAQQADHSQAFIRIFRHSGWLLRARRVAAYLPVDGELDLRPLWPLLQGRRRELFLPVLRAHPEPRLWFVAHPAAGPLLANRFGIPEPPWCQRRICPPWALDLILVPLVGFDAEGRRLGMGGGYYDRTLAYLGGRRHWRKPHLVGVAHECQRVARLPARSWDVPLDMVITERRCYVRSV